MQTCRCSFGPRITAIVRTRVIVPTTAFRSADRNQNTPFGHTKNLTRQSPTLKPAWRFTPRGSMHSKGSPKYENQHSDHIPPGRDGMFNLIKSLPPTLKYEPGAIVAEGDIVIVHGRFSA